MFGIDNILLLLAAWIAAESAHQPIARYSLIGLVVIGYLVALLLSSRSSSSVSSPAASRRELATPILLCFSPQKLS